MSNCCQLPLITVAIMTSVAYAFNPVSNHRKCWELIVLPSLRHCLVTSRSMLKKITVTYSFIRVRSSVSLVSLLCSIKPGSQSLQPVRNCHWNYSIQGVRPTVCWALCSLGLRDSKMQNTTHENFPVNEREPRYAVDWATLPCRESNTNPGLG